MMRYTKKFWHTQEEKDAGKPPHEMVCEFDRDDIAKARELDRRHSMPEECAEGRVLAAMVWLKADRFLGGPEVPREYVDNA